MEDLHFKIVVVPTVELVSEYESARKTEQIKQRLKFNVQACNLQDIDMQLSKVKTSDDDDSPEVEELVFDVRAKLRVTGQRKKASYYKELYKNWKTVGVDLSFNSVLMFFENDCFPNPRKSCHSTTFSTISFGVLPHDNTYQQYVALKTSSAVGDSKVVFYHDVRSVRLECGSTEATLSYDNIRNIFVNTNELGCEMFFEMCNPPLVFEVEQKYGKYTGRYTLRRRTSSLPGVDLDIFGRGNVMKLTLGDATAAEEIIGKIHFSCSEKPVHYAPIVTVRASQPPDPIIDFPHFGCAYLLTAILRRNFTVASQKVNLNSSINELRVLCNQNGDTLEKALVLVLAALDLGKIVNFWHAINKQFQHYSSNKDEIDYKHYVVPEKCRVIRRVTLTPTRWLLWAPEIMFSNRVLRNFDSEYALRVAFRDENNSRLSFIAVYARDNVFENSIRKPLTSGLRIGSRLYEFLAWSNSQIRDHGIWMYARDAEGKTVRDIRTWMGDFSHIHTVPKYMARMGQCFSQTEDAVSVPLDPRHVRTEKDITGGRDVINGDKPYCFSDGIGKISTKLAKEVRDSLGHDKLCSAFQIRYGGCKGMLVEDPTLQDTNIVFRESMKKFESPQNIQLEIAKTSAPIPLQLNRPFITILNEMGVRHRTFLKLQEEMLHTLTDMLFDEEQAAAFLESKTPSQLFDCRELSRSGVFLTTEPFFRALLLALHRHHVGKIKSHANIAIHPDQGRNMLGVLDETATLRCGEVFVQYTKDIVCGETTRKTVIVQSEVLVTKNPCLLPGDVRKFRAVDVPALHHITDCIVFPQRGPRPHPNEMGGSDLDGDEYAVIWNKDLIFYRPNEAPGHFPSESVHNTHNIEESHMIDFLIKYIQNDQVGSIANAHLARSDTQGIFHPTCLGIAKKFSFAVDYAKTGVSKHLEREERPDKFPDFMEKNHKDGYRSDKALGKMYRVAVDYESENADASVTYRDVKADPDLAYPGWETYKKSAVASRNKFNTLLKTVLRNYGIQHEAEVFSAAFTKLHCRFQERKDRDEIEKVVVRCIKRLSNSMKEEFLEEFKQCTNVNDVQVPILQKASAWYMVTYGDKDAKFLSFPWAVSQFLASIKVRKFVPNPRYASPIVEKMDRRIQECESRKMLPSYTDTRDWADYKYICDKGIVQEALRVLVLWAQENEIVERPSHNAVGLMYLSVFSRLFLHVAETAGYIVNVQSGDPVAKSRKDFSAAALCLEFLSFCLKLRFYHQHEILEIVPFQVYKYSKLSKMAVVAYHRFAVRGVFHSLYPEDYADQETMHMRDIYINSKIFQGSPISEAALLKAMDALFEYSKVKWVTLREVHQTKKVVVVANGTEESLKSLKSILRKKDVFMAELFRTGKWPGDQL